MTLIEDKYIDLITSIEELRNICVCLKDLETNHENIDCLLDNLCTAKVWALQNLGVNYYNSLISYENINREKLNY